MQYRQLSMLLLPAVALVAAVLLTPTEAFDPVSISVGGTVLYLTGTQVALGVAGLAGLAITKESLLIADLSRRSSRRSSGRGRSLFRGRRDAELDFSLVPFFEAIAYSDVADCGKMLVCQIMATPVEQRTAMEKSVSSLFDEVVEVDPASGYASYVLAAKIGSLGRPQLCGDRYARCPANSNELHQILEVHSGQTPELRI